MGGVITPCFFSLKKQKKLGNLIAEWLTNKKGDAGTILYVQTKNIASCENR